MYDRLGVQLHIFGQQRAATGAVRVRRTVHGDCTTCGRLDDDADEWPAVAGGFLLGDSAGHPRTEGISVRTAGGRGLVAAMVLDSGVQVVHELGSEAVGCSEADWNRSTAGSEF